MRYTCRLDIDMGIPIDGAKDLLVVIDAPIYQPHHATLRIFALISSYQGSTMHGW